MCACSHAHCVYMCACSIMNCSSQCLQRRHLIKLKLSQLICKKSFTQILHEDCTFSGSSFLPSARQFQESRRIFITSDNIFSWRVLFSCRNCDPTFSKFILTSSGALSNIPLFKQVRVKLGKVEN